MKKHKNRWEKIFYKGVGKKTSTGSGKKRGDKEECRGRIIKKTIEEEL